MKYRLLGAFALIFLFSALVSAAPFRTTYQAKIIKPDGQPLQASSVNFRFTILDPTATCILYVEDYSAINMHDSGGLAAFSLGAGVRSFPTSGTSQTFQNIFDNSIASFPCQAAGVYLPVSSDIRKIVMQFNDGTGWQSLQAMTINAVPYSMYATKSDNSIQLNGKSDTAFVEYSTLAALSCQANEAIHFNGASFSCLSVGGSVTSGSVITALGYTPADGASVTALTSSLSSTNSTVSVVSSTVFSVSSTVSSLAGVVSSLQNSVAASFASVTSSQWTTSGTNIFYNTGNVGIGTIDPQSKLALYGSDPRLTIEGDSGSSQASIGFKYFGSQMASIMYHNTTGLLIQSNNNSPVILGGNYQQTVHIMPTGKVGIGTGAPVTSLEVSGGVRISMESATCATSFAGTLRYNASNVEYCNGTSWQAFGVSGAGITNFNGATSGTQSLVTGTGGTAPAFNTSNGVHTLNIPLASTGSVTAGLISNTDYTTFTNKITSSAASIAQVLGYVPADNATSGTYAQKANNLSDLTNVATARTNLGLGTFATASSIDLSSASATGTLATARLPAFTGDATIAAASNTIILSNSGVAAGTYTKVTVDAKGRVTSGAQVTSSDVVTALGYTPANSATIISSQWSTSGTTINYMTGNVGIGTTAPANLFHVEGPNTIAWTNTAKFNAGQAGSDNAGSYISIQPASASGRFDGGRIYGGRWNATASGTRGLKLAATDWSGAQGVNAEYNYILLDSGNNSFSVNTNNAERLRIDSSGNVGIGTSTPYNWPSAGVLEIHGTSNGNLRLSGGASSADIYSNSFGDIIFAHNGVSRNYFSSAGRLGLGLFTGAATRLHQDEGNATATYHKFTAGTTTGQTSSDGFDVGIDNTGNARLVQREAAAMIFSTSGTERMRLDSAGNLGIGITAPSAQLHLAAGTSSNASFKLTSGTLLTSPQSGTIEYDGANFYVTDGTNTRRAIAANTNPGIYDNVSNINSSGNITVTPTGSVIVSATTASANSQTGALVVKGGLGVAGNIYASGTIITSSNIQGSVITATSATITPFVYGSTVSGGVLTLDSTTHASKGNIILAPTGGNVGIGTASPSAKFSVIGTRQSTVTPSNAISQIGGDDVFLYLGAQPAGSYAVMLQAMRNSDSFAFPISLQPNGGNIGIGITSPGATLDVSGSIRVPGVGQIGPNGGYGYAMFKQGTASTFIGQMYGAVSGIQFTNSSGANTVHIKDDGNVGIGTASPSSPLEIYQSGLEGLRFNRSGMSSTFRQRFSNNGTEDTLLIESLTSLSLAATSSGKVGVGTAAPIGKFQVVGVAGNNSGLVVTSPNANQSLDVMPGYRLDGTANGAQEDITMTLRSSGVSTGNLAFATGNNEAMRINQSGNVGIGTIAPSSKLHVNGTITADGLTDSSAGTALYLTTASTTAGVGSIYMNDSEAKPMFEVAPMGPRTNYSWLRLDAGTDTLIPHIGTFANAANPGLSLGVGTVQTLNIISGNVGIGTTTPDRILHLKQNSPEMIFEENDQVADARKWRIWSSSGQLSFQPLTDAITGSPSPAMEIARNGNIGIGTTSPVTNLQVGGGGAYMAIPANSYPYIPAAWRRGNAGGMFFANSQNADGTGWSYGTRIINHDYGNGLALSFDALYGGTWTNDVLVVSGRGGVGNVGIGTSSPSEKLHVVGNLRVQGSTDCTLGNGAGGTNCSSDARLKENIKPIPYALEKVISLKGVEFDWNAKSLSYGRHDIGVIAQDVEKVFPTAVMNDKNTGYKKVDYAILVAPLIEALKSLYERIVGVESDLSEQKRQIASDIEVLKQKVAEVDALKAKSDKLEAENAKLKSRLEKIEKALNSK